MLGLWHQARRSLLKSQQHLLNKAEDMLQAMPEAIRDRLPASKAVWPRLRALATLSDEMAGEDWDAPTALRLRLLGEHARAISELEQREEEIGQAGQADRLDARPALRYLDAFGSRAAGRGG